MQWVKLIGMLVFLLLMAVISLGVPALIIYRIIKGVKKHGPKTLDLVKRGERTNARIVREIMDTGGRNHRRTVVYEFEAEGETWQGDLADRDLKIGDEIEIEYVPGNPSDNSPAVVVDAARKSAPRQVLD